MSDAEELYGSGQEDWQFGFEDDDEEDYFDDEDDFYDYFDDEDDFYDDDDDEEFV